ncbi:MAG TPA: branched-chain amino acid ABC transporter substrate-binding protein [Atribacterota bacterium]|nr:branched-chain amino acid ABC transporter substrate-binding protein [Atribacterota bacterium]
MNKIKLSLGILILALVFSLSCLGALSQDKPPVVIGLQAPITGDYAIEGEMAKQCVETAARLINEEGGVIDGRMIEIEVVDDAFQPRAGALAATKFISMDEIVAVISTYGSPLVQATSDIYEKAEMINIAYGATNTDLSERGLKYFFRTCGRTDTQGKFFVDEVVPYFDAKRIAIMHDNNTFSLGLAEETIKALQANIDSGEVELVYFDGITPGESDYTVPLTKLRETNPDIFYYTAMFPEAGLIIRQAREIGIDVPFVGGDAAINEDFIRIAGLEYAAGCYQTQEALIEYFTNPEAVEFKENYKDAYGDLPSSPWSVYAGDALMVLAEAIDKTGSTDSDVLVDYLKNEMKEFPSITGPIGFDEKGDRVGTGINLYVVNDDGSYSIVER